MMFLAPALGVPNEYLLQDTFKSLLVCGCTLIAALLFFWCGRKQATKIHLHVLLILPLALMIYALVSMAWSHAYLGAVEAIRWFIFSLILLLGLNRLTLNSVTQLAWGIHLGAVVASLWAALQFWVDFRLFPQGPNPASTFINRNIFAEYLVCALPFSVLLLTKVKDKFSVFLLAFSVCFNVVALLMTGTRSSLLGLVLLTVSLPSLVWYFRRQIASTDWRMGHGISLLVLMVTTVVALGSINTANPRLIAEFGPGNAIDRAIHRTLTMTNPSEYSNGSFSVRAQMWKATGRMIRANPLAGVGAGAWEVQAPIYQAAGSLVETDYYAHNELLQLVAEYGVTGWLFFIGLLSYLAWTAYQIWIDKSPEGQQEALPRAFALASLCALLLVSNAGFPWHMATTGALFALGLSLIAIPDIRHSIGRGLLWQELKCKAYCSTWALYATILCISLTIYIGHQAIECERKLVSAIKIGMVISQSGTPNDPVWQPKKLEMLRLLQEGISINPHYRKLTPMAADLLANWGDWKNATWIWESQLESRPHVVAMLVNVARGYIQTGNLTKAQNSLERAKVLQPAAPAVNALEVILWIRMGKDQDAAKRAKELLRSGGADFDLVRSAYFLGMRTKDPALAILALEVLIKTWHNQAVDGWLKLGQIYDTPEAKDQTKAMASYQAAYEAANTDYKSAVLAMIPEIYHARIK